MLEPLVLSEILAQLPPQAQTHLTALEIFPSIASTNQYLLTDKTKPQGSVCLAEEQTAGRGRQGKLWYSPRYSNIYLSLLWQFKTFPLGLSLAVGVCLIRALHQCGVPNIGLKWPNDILYQHRKLAGILVESWYDAHHQVYRTVIGIGLNVAMPPQVALEQPWIDLRAILPSVPSRNILASLIIAEVLLAMPLFASQGLSAFQSSWQQFDLLYGQEITVHTATHTVTGIGQGIDQQGQLLLQSGKMAYAFNSGEVSVRLR